MIAFLPRTGRNRERMGVGHFPNSLIGVAVFIRLMFSKVWHSEIKSVAAFRMSMMLESVIFEHCGLAHALYSFPLPINKSAALEISLSIPSTPLS